MIDTSRAKWDLSSDEQYVIKWFNDHGFDGEIIIQYISKTKFRVCKDGVEDYFELIQGVKDIDIKSYMQQYLMSFNLLCQIKSIKKQISEQNLKITEE